MLALKKKKTPDPRLHIQEFAVFKSLFQTMELILTQLKGLMSITLEMRTVTLLKGFNIT